MCESMYIDMYRLSDNLNRYFDLISTVSEIQNLNRTFVLVSKFIIQSFIVYRRSMGYRL